MPLADLAFLVGNPMLHADQQVEELRASLRQFGQVLPLVVNLSTTPPEIIGGNGRMQAMLAENWTWAAVSRQALTPDRARALALVLNASQSQSWDKVLLAEAFKDINTGNDPALDAMMASLGEQLKLVPAPASPPPPPPPAAPEPISLVCPACGHTFCVEGTVKGDLKVCENPP